MEEHEIRGNVWDVWKSMRISMIYNTFLSFLISTIIIIFAFVTGVLGLRNMVPDYNQLVVKIKRIVKLKHYIHHRIQWLDECQQIL